MVIHVTGAGGFIGKRLVHSLELQAHEVATSGKDGALRPWEAMEYGAPDVVVHLGAVGKNKPIEYTLLYNVASPAAWAQHCSEIGTRFIYVGTYEPAYLSWYAQTKRWGEEAVRHYTPADRLQIVELGPVYGTDSKAAPMEFLRAARAGVPIQAMDDTSRSYLHVTDVVWAICALATDSEWHGRAYVQRDDDRWTMVALARYCCELCDRDPDALVEVIPQADGFAAHPLFVPWRWKHIRPITLSEGLERELAKLEQYVGE